MKGIIPTAWVLSFLSNKLPLRSLTRLASESRLVAAVVAVWFLNIPTTLAAAPGLSTDIGALINLQTLVFYLLFRIKCNN